MILSFRQRKTYTIRETPVISCIVVSGNYQSWQL